MRCFRSLAVRISKVNERPGGQREVAQRLDRQRLEAGVEVRGVERARELGHMRWRELLVEQPSPLDLGGGRLAAGGWRWVVGGGRWAVGGGRVGAWARGR